MDSCAGFCAGCSGWGAPCGLGDGVAGIEPDSTEILVGLEKNINIYHSIQFNS